MVPLPQALGLTLCERVIIEQGTKNPSLICCFLGRSVERFPSEPVTFSAFAPLTGGAGPGSIRLSAVHLETDEEIYSQTGAVEFPDRFVIVHAHFRVGKIVFPAPGSYEFVLLIDDDLVATRRLSVYLR